MAGAVKGQVKIAYWDTEQRGSPPRLLGEIKGTPTIRFFKPKKQQKTKGSHAQKTVMDYNQERKAKDMRTFLEYNMPSYVERISFGEADMTKAVAKADKYGLPKAILFPSKPKTSSVVKYLSTEFRRRLLLMEVVPTKKNQVLMQEYGLSTDQLPALMIVTPKGDKVVYDAKDFSRRKLERFLSEHAMKEPVYSPVVVPEDDASTAAGAGKEEEEQKKEKPVHTEF